MDKWDDIEETKEVLIDRLEKSNGKDFQKSIDSLRKICSGLDPKELDTLAHAVSERLLKERHPLVLRGSIFALGLLTAGVTARVTLEAIARAPERYPNWLWAPAAESLLRMGWGSHFTRHFLASISNRETSLPKRVSIVESVNAFSALGRQLAKDSALVEEAISSVEPPVRDALVKLMNWARK
ncbi:MAG: hypothetical protein M1358_25920 [Chloroflexi bacterium]|nr:hypothetical protein [Chloroflexota bacterium]